MNIFHGHEASQFGVQQVLRFSKHNQVHVDNQSDKMGMDHNTFTQSQ